MPMCLGVGNIDGSYTVDELNLLTVRYIPQHLIYTRKVHLERDILIKELL